MDKVKVSDKLLLSVEKPARYTGGELNSILEVLDYLLPEGRRRRG